MRFERTDGTLIAETESLRDYCIHNKADLHDADLRWAKLYGADLHGADLRWAKLYGADLRGADLHGADLHGADLRWAKLYGADLRGADLYVADLRGADLHGADLHGADLRWADLRRADLRGVQGTQCLTWTDHGYLVYAEQRTDGQWRIMAGCRDFSVEEALAHWGHPDYHTPQLGRRICAVIRWWQEESK